MNNTNTNTIDYTYVRKLKQYPTEWISDAIETFSEWELSRKPWIEFRGLHFDRSDFDFAALDEKHELIKFLDMVQAGMKNEQQQRTVILRQCRECGKTFRAFSNSHAEFCSLQCAEDHFIRLGWTSITTKNKKTKNRS